MKLYMRKEITWHLEKRHIDELKQYHKNPREISKRDEAELCYSIDTFGLIDKPFINVDNTIIGGHQRMRVLKKLGFKEIEVNVPDRKLSDREVEELNIRHNKNTGDWDYDLLANEYEIADLINWGFLEEELLGSDEEDITPFAKVEEETQGICPECKQKIKGK